MLTKVDLSQKTNPCADGTASCGENTICVPNDTEELFQVSIHILTASISKFLPTRNRFAVTPCLTNRYNYLSYCLGRHITYVSI